jgi:signal transduction histidine kinase
MMPIMNGLEMLQQVKERDPEQMVVVMTGYADKDIILRALKAHADDFIQKPINLLQLRTTIEKALEKKALRWELLQLKQLDRIKTEFLGLISHKLRTPTTSISLFIQNLANGTLDFQDPGVVQALDAVRKESEYLAGLIQDLLYYSDIILQDSATKSTREDLKLIANGIVVEKLPAAESKGLTLQSHLDERLPHVIVDRRRIAFALGAVLDNAIKFTASGGTITVSGTVEEDQCTLVVRDTGPGIAPEEISKVFEKFYQVDPQRTGQVRGFGLGLFYARQFIRDHGGTVQLISTSGKGTEVTIRLPSTVNAQEPPSDQGD